jgi:hypothetical protein
MDYVSILHPRRLGNQDPSKFRDILLPKNHVVKDLDPDSLGGHRRGGRRSWTCESRCFKLEGVETRETGLLLTWNPGHRDER